MTQITETNKLLNFKDFVHRSDTFIETGTCYGGSLLRAIDSGYKKLKSVEAYEKFYIHCVILFSYNKDVELFFGKSDELMPKMLQGVEKQCVIFLDAHPAGENTAGHDDLMAKGDKSEFHQHYILTKEIKAILEHNPKHIIIIDDQNGRNPENEFYINLILEANPDYEFFFYDEQAGPNFYKNKSLVCIPKINNKTLSDFTNPNLGVPYL